ncbi:branched-chain amino acid transport system II carrier protein [Clostridium sp. D2Q-11]|uniref:Branched-chain amino acid transport system carrier protein n=1 Tax=Anaeromonas frigoriresistens TaxID=2683708 RepID=A0A942UZH7_9FIRM|nr:branched-chain amino acid transport system II carrier protein [Anaeromonas frigoriresistens]MBS4538422.1 branched-chain amino acid transport system II carrier protein [Anaeromonas frigoriresistens]
MTKKINIDSIILGLALFAMFFGAGNLIFPPSIGINAGDNWFSAMIGFFLTGIGMPLLGILAISKAGGTLENFAGKVSPRFDKIYGVIAVVVLGPLLGVPRTGATTYEMGISPIFESISPIVVSIVFFSLTLFLVIKPSGIIDRIGKILTPILLIMLAIIIYKGITAPIGAPLNTGMVSPFSKGFTEGYQTMDVIVSTIIGGIIVKSLIEKGYKDKKTQFKITLRAGLISATGLAIVYGGLLYLGATGSSVFSADMAKTSLTVAIVGSILGEIGKVVLGVCVTAACLTTSVGITATVGDLFSEISGGKLSYKLVVTLSTILSAIIANVGVESIVAFAAPLLAVIYPVAIILVILNLFDGVIPNKKAYTGAVYGTLMVSVLDGIKALGVESPIVNSIMGVLPLADKGFGWIVPAIIGILIAVFITKLNNPRRLEKEYA